MIIALVEGIKALKYADSVDRRQPREGPQPVDFPPVRHAKHELEADDDDH